MAKKYNIKKCLSLWLPPIYLAQGSSQEDLIFRKYKKIKVEDYKKNIYEEGIAFPSLQKLEIGFYHRLESPTSLNYLTRVHGYFLGKIFYNLLNRNFKTISVSESKKNKAIVAGKSLFLQGALFKNADKTEHFLKRVFTHNRAIVPFLETLSISTDDIIGTTTITIEYPLECLEKSRLFEKEIEGLLDPKDLYLTLTFTLDQMIHEIDATEFFLYYFDRAYRGQIKFPK